MASHEPRASLRPEFTDHNRPKTDSKLACLRSSGLRAGDGSSWGVALVVLHKSGLGGSGFWGNGDIHYLVGTLFSLVSMG